MLLKIIKKYHFLEWDLTRSTATELRTFFSTVPDYDLWQLLNLEYLAFGEYKWKGWKPVTDYRLIRGKDGKFRRQKK